jgi:hypothetical protein
MQQCVKLIAGEVGNFSPLPRFNPGVYADWNDARKPRLILHVNVNTHTKKDQLQTNK